MRATLVFQYAVRQETAEERKVRLRKLAMWNAAQRKGMSGVFGQDESTVDIKAPGLYTSIVRGIV